MLRRFFNSNSCLSTEKIRRTNPDKINFFSFQLLRFVFGTTALLLDTTLSFVQNSTKSPLTCSDAIDMTNTRKNRRYCTRSCWRHCWHEILSIIKKSIPVVIAQLIGWALFSYVEDDLNILDCLSRPGSLAGRMHKVNDEKKREIELFTRLYFKTSQFLSENQSKVMYHQFKEHFDVPDPLYLSKDDAIFLGCIKWYRFSVMTMTTIGKCREPD